MLVERVSSEAEAAEVLNSVISGYLNRFVERIYSYGGDVISFVGDALLVVFKPQDSSFSTDRDTTTCTALDEVLSQAAQCCQSILCDFHDYRVEEVPGMTLNVHMGVSCGNLTVSCVGGENRNWLFLVSGDAAREGVRLQASSGECRFSPSAMNSLNKICVFKYLRCHDLMTGQTILTARDQSKASGSSSERHSSRSQLPWPVPTPIDFRICESFLPSRVLKFSEDAVTNFPEFRNCTVAFVCLEDFDFGMAGTFTDTFL